MATLTNNGVTLPGTSQVPLLCVSKLSKRFGGLVAVNDVSFELRVGHILGIIGPNGSGKTTTINLLSGLIKPDSGAISIGDYDITRLPAYRHAQLGLNRTFQVPKPLKTFSVQENIELARHMHRDSISKTWNTTEILQILGLLDKTGTSAGALTAAEQKRLDLGRALATSPNVILVDEIAAGLTANEVGAMAKLLRLINAEGVGLIVVEHIMSFMRSLMCPVLVMNNGSVIFEGSLAEAQDDNAVRRVFFGTEAIQP